MIEIDTSKYELVPAWVIKRAIMETHKAGNTIAITGQRGGGKTHLAVWLIEWLVKRGWIVLTNILFMKRVGTGEYDFIEEYPPNIIKIRSMAEMYYYAAMILKENRKAKIAVVRDEAQNYIIAFKANSQMEVELFRSEGDYRKFNILSVYLTPTFDYLPKGIREQYIKAHYFKIEEVPHKGIFGFSAFHSKPAVVRIGLGEWARPYELVPVGGYVYDTLASASMDMGKVGGREFDIIDFRNYYSGRIFTEIPNAILEYFRAKGGIDTLNRDLGDKYATKNFILECFRRGLTPKILLPYVNEEVSRSTLYRWWKEWNDSYTE